VPQGQALAVVQIDTQDNGHAAAAIEALRKVEAIASVRLVKLEK
jgi:D-3-phosphoglycerate dehydrogenase